MDLITVVSSTAASRRDDDWTDRLNHIYTAMLLVLFAVVVTSRQYVGDPINCWCPAQFTGNYVHYTSNICWVKNTYYIPMNEGVPEGEKNKPQLRYYQWMPLILLSLALFYQIPCLLWRGHNEQSGMNLENMISIARRYVEAGTTEEKDKCVKMLSRHFDRYLDMRKRWSFRRGLALTCLCRGRKYGNFLTVLYLSVKLLYLANALAQFVLTDLLLTGGLHFYGLQLLNNFLAARPNPGSFYFPRVTLCDFHVREMGFEIVGHRYTVQCVLSINLFSEAIFAFYWFWLALLVIFNAFSLAKWLFYSLFSSSAFAYARKHIRPELFDQQDYALSLFVRDYLRSDGLFALRLVSHNSTDIVVTDLVSAMYENYKIRSAALESEKHL